MVLFLRTGSVLYFYSRGQGKASNLFHVCNSNFQYIWHPLSVALFVLFPSLQILSASANQHEPIRDRPAIGAMAEPEKGSHGIGRCAADAFQGLAWRRAPSSYLTGALHLHPTPLLPKLFFLSFY